MRRRHDALHPLSHHHHHALVAALKLKRAGTEKSTVSISQLRDELHAFWHPGGQEHFREEEEILFPAFAEFGGLDHPEISEALLEHVHIRSLVQQITRADDPSPSLMQKLGATLEAHIRKEERVIFPLIEDSLPEDVLADLAPYFHMNWKAPPKK